MERERGAPEAGAAGLAALREGLEETALQSVTLGEVTDAQGGAVQDQSLKGRECPPANGLDRIALQPDLLESAAGALLPLRAKPQLCELRALQLHLHIRYIQRSNLPKLVRVPAKQMVFKQMVFKQMTFNCLKLL